MPRNRRPALPLDLAQLEAADDISLFVAWRRGSRLESGEIRIADEVADHLRTAVAETIETLRATDLYPYTPELSIEPDEGMYVHDDALVADSPFTAAVLPDDPPQLLRARSLPERSLLLYAVNFVSDQGPVAFVRKKNPQTVARPGRMYALLGNALTAIEQPVFSFEPGFDLIVSEHGVIATSINVFELLFRETDAVLAQVPDWVESIADHLPLAGDGAELLADKARSSSRLRRRLRSIHERGHLAHVGIEDVRRHIRDLGLPEDELIDGDELMVDEADPITLLYLLNEDFFTGGLTASAFRSERKALRP